MSTFSDHHRYRNTLILAHLGWWGTVVVVVLRAMEAVPQSVGLASLLTLGLGITASLSLSRMRLGDTISQVFNAGMKAAITLSANVFTDTCIMALDDQGRIASVDHSDAIGWDADAILGRYLRDLLAPRSHSKPMRVLEPGTSITSPMLNQEGGAFDARISLATLGQHVNSDGVQSENLTMVATISPIVTSSGVYELHNS